MAANETPVCSTSDAAHIKTNLRFYMSAAFCVALAVAVVAIAIFGANERGLSIALRLTARVSFLLFLAAYAGSAAVIVFGSKFAFLARHQREFGLSFAAAYLVHVGLVIWLYLLWFYGISPERPIPDSSAIIFGIGIAFLYGLALLSIDYIRKLLNPVLWKTIRIIGMHYIAYLFYIDFTGPLFNGLKQPIAYVPFAILIVLGVGVRGVAFVITREWKRHFQNSRAFIGGRRTGAQTAEGSVTAERYSVRLLARLFAS